MPKILSFDSGQFVKYPLFNRLKDWWDTQDKFLKLTLVTIVLLAISTPVIVSTYLTIRQEASNANRKMWLGMSTHESTGLKRFGGGVDVPGIEAELELIKKETGAYPAVYALFLNLRQDSLEKPLLNIFNYLDSKGITPAMYIMPVANEVERRDGRFTLATPSEQIGVGEGEIRFDSATPSAITKIYVSKKANGTENPKIFLAPTWLNGQTIEVFGTQEGNNNIDYTSERSFRFEITSDIQDVPPVSNGYWVISVRPIKTTTFDKAFAPGSPVFISPSNALAKKFANASIARGVLDDKFKVYADAAKEFGKPVLLRYAWEMNGKNFPWGEGKPLDENGVEWKLKTDPGNGTPGSEIKGYGRNRYFDINNTADNYVKSWRHVYNFMKPIASNLKFFWCPLSSNTDRYRDFFPGEDYVEYVGFDGYSGISSFPHRSLVDIAREPVSTLRGLTKKPIIIGETGINSIPKEGDPFPPENIANYRRKWIREGFPELFEQYPSIVGVLYFNLDMRPSEANNNWLLSNAFSNKPESQRDDIPEIIGAYRNLLLDPRFQGGFKAGGGDNPEPPSITITPAPGSDSDPKGYHDGSSCVVSTGWACDLDGYQQALNIEFYADNPKGSGGILLGNVNANLVREQAVGAQCGGNSSHGFTFATPVTLSDGKAHKIYAYATNIGDGKTTLLKGSPKTITCGAGGTTIFTTSILAVEDSYSNVNLPKQNYGRSIYLKADASPVNVTYLKFDTSAYKNKTVKSAILELTVSKLEDAQSALAKGLDVRSISNSWKDTSITHANHPLYGAIIKTHQGAVKNGDKLRIDITDYIKSNLGVVSFALANRGSDGVIFNSMESTGAKPKLIITYEN